MDYGRGEEAGVSLKEWTVGHLKPPAIVDEGG